MRSSTTHAPVRMQAVWPQIVFSLQDARRALAYVCRVVRDATESYHEAQRCRRMLSVNPISREAAQFAERRDRALERLNAATDECNAVGADLLDLSLGLVRFPAQIDGQPVSLLWRLGDPMDDPWRDLRENVAGNCSPNESLTLPQRSSDC